MTADTLTFSSSNPQRWDQLHWLTHFIHQEQKQAGRGDHLSSLQNEIAEGEKKCLGLLN